MRNKRLLLICDDDKGSLGDVALQLVRLGAGASYAADPFEAELMAREAGRKVRALMLPADVTPERIDEVLDSIGSHSAIGLEDVAVLGRRPSDQHVDLLREHGVLWRLWSPYEDRDLRFLVGGMLWAGTDDDLRIDARIPTALPARAVRRNEPRDVLVGDLSRSGAYLETPDPFPAGSQVHLSISLPVGEVEFVGITRWVASGGQGPEVTRPPGFGIEFLERPDGSLRAVIDHLHAERNRFAL